MRRYRTGDSSGKRTESRRPRHIRDIAHLYLSRSKRNGEKPAEAPSINILLTSDEKSCFSGLHAANLAAAFSLRRAEVRVYELSGILPNASFYFAHPARVYLAEDTRPPSVAVPGLGGVSVLFDGVDAPVAGSPSETTRVNLFHLPPAATIAAVAEETGGVAPHGKGDRWGLLLAHSTDAVSAHGDSIRRTLATRGLFVLALHRTTPDPPSAPDVGDLGRLEHWEGTLADRVPVVLRDPSAQLSRAYLSISDSILGRVSASRRTLNDRVQRAARQPSRTAGW